MNKLIFISFILILASFSGDRIYKDGCYSAISRDGYTSEHYYGHVTINIDSGKITGVRFFVRDSAKHVEFDDCYERYFAGNDLYIINAGVTCCALSYGTNLPAKSLPGMQDSKPDPKALEYCGYKCPADCPLKKGTLENNLELKKKVYADFEFKKKYGIEFEPEKVFCYGCKSAPDKPVSMPVNACIVRKCVLEKKMDCCIQCNNLTKCDKELWIRFPKFRDAVIEMQKKFKAV